MTDQHLTVAIGCTADESGALDRVALADALHKVAALIMGGHDAGTVRGLDGETRGVFAIAGGAHAGPSESRCRYCGVTVEYEPNGFGAGLWRTEDGWDCAGPSPTGVHHG